MKEYFENLASVFAPVFLPLIKQAVKETMAEIHEDYLAGVNAEDENLTADELCERWSICKATLYNYQKDGVVTPIHVGGRKVVYKMEDILAAEAAGKIKK
mgnify:CR=1 FL=1